MPRTKELDSLRGLAALSIVIYHLWFPKALFGWTRVDFFFVLSGYLITTASLRKSGVPGFYATFLLRRAVRLVPPYVVALLGLMAINPLLARPSPLTALPYYLTFTQNFTMPRGGDTELFSPNFQHTWSLALEVQFSALWPPLVAAMGRRRLLAICPALALVGAAARGLGVSPYVLPGRCDGFALGALLAAWPTDVGPESRPGRGATALLGGAGLAALGVVVAGMNARWDTLRASPVPWPGLSILATNVAYAAIVGLVVRRGGHPSLAPLRWRGLVGLGALSYSLYLFHPLAFKAVELTGRGLGLGRGPAMEWLMIPASGLAAALSWAALERPFEAMRGRLAYGQRPGAAAARRLDLRSHPRPGGHSPGPLALECGGPPPPSWRRGGG